MRYSPLIRILDLLIFIGLAGVFFVVPRIERAMGIEYGLGGFYVSALTLIVFVIVQNLKLQYYRITRTQLIIHTVASILMVAVPAIAIMSDLATVRRYGVTTIENVFVMFLYVFSALVVFPIIMWLVRLSSDPIEGKAHKKE